MKFETETLFQIERILYRDSSAGQSIVYLLACYEFFYYVSKFAIIETREQGRLRGNIDNNTYSIILIRVHCLFTRIG